MPKSKHAKGRRAQYNKTRRPQTTAAVASSAAAVPAGAVAAPAMVKPAPAPKVQGYKPATTEQYPYFVSELRSISVLTAVIIVVLIVLSFVLN